MVREGRQRKGAAFAVATLLAAVHGFAANGADVAAGRRVYLAEGCINCHSQYVRPGSADEIRWGPRGPLGATLAEKPPLIGNRRQGPDLANVGARRSGEWQRIHLQVPRLITPGSRMPSYAHLFSAGQPGAASAGDALVAYLDSLGDARREEHWQEIRAWRPGATDAPPPRTSGRELFRENCAACHGPGGAGDGPLAGRLASAPRDLRRADWRHLPRDLRGAAEKIEIARIVKYGVPGTAMAGREYLGDAEVLSLAAHVQSLRAVR